MWKGGGEMTEQSLAIFSCVLAIVIFNELTESRINRNIFALFLAVSLYCGGLL